VDEGLDGPAVFNVRGAKWRLRPIGQDQDIEIGSFGSVAANRTAADDGSACFGEVFRDKTPGRFNWV
jgi:hypothetical protein